MNGVKMRNIILFDAYVAEILNTLYKNFPVCKDLNVAELVYAAKLDSKESDDKQKEICSETIHWLRESGVINVYKPTMKDFYLNKDVHRVEEMFTCVVLTAKGLQILKQVPRSLKSGTSLGDEINDALKQGLKSKASDLVGIALGGVATMVGG